MGVEGSGSAQGADAETIRDELKKLYETGRDSMSRARAEKRALDRLAVVVQQRDELARAIQAHLEMMPPVTASPYWTKSEGDLRAALASVRNAT